MEITTEKKIIKEIHLNNFKVIWTEQILSEENRQSLNMERLRKTIDFISTVSIKKV